jgi:hypothetical protein
MAMRDDAARVLSGAPMGPGSRASAMWSPVPRRGAVGTAVVATATAEASDREAARGG